MGRLKKFRTESEVSTFRIPRIEDSEERQYFRNMVNNMIHDLAWIRYSYSLLTKEDGSLSKEKHKQIFKQNSKTCTKNVKVNLLNFISYYNWKYRTLNPPDADSVLQKKSPGDKYCNTKKITLVVDIHKIKGIRPEFDKYVGREVRDRRTGKIMFEKSKWYNPYPYKKYGLQAAPMYETYIRQKIEEDPEYYDLDELIGFRLGCWCNKQKWYVPGSCHADILVKLIKEKQKKGGKK